MGGGLGLNYKQTVLINLLITYALTQDQVFSKLQSTLSSTSSTSMTDATRSPSPIGTIKFDPNNPPRWEVAAKMVINILLSNFRKIVIANLGKSAAASAAASGLFDVEKTLSILKTDPLYRMKFNKFKKMYKIYKTKKPVYELPVIYGGLGRKWK